MKFQFINETQILIDILKTKSVSELKEIMDLSDNLAQVNWQRFQDWDFSNHQTYYAISMFQGAVFQSIRVDSFSKDQMDFAQQSIRIISGLYGLLNPLDVILPYRLEMGTKIKNSKGNHNCCILFICFMIYINNFLDSA